MAAATAFERTNIAAELSVATMTAARHALKVANEKLDVLAASIQSVHNKIKQAEQEHTPELTVVQAVTKLKTVA